MKKNKQINNKYRKTKPNFEKNSKKRDKKDPVSESEFQKHYSSFEIHLKRLGLGLKDIEGDGNCLFRAVCDQLEGSEENYKFYRSITCEYLGKNEEFFKFFIPDDIKFETYLKLIRNDGVWGGNLELQALSKALKINIVVHMLDRPALILINDHEKLKIKEIKTLHLAYHYGESIAEHYSSVRNLDDLQSKEPAEPVKFNIEQNVYEEDEEKKEEEDVEEIINMTKKLNIQENLNEDYPKNKKCFCGSKKAYKNCCLLNKKKELQKPKNTAILI